MISGSLIGGKYRLIRQIGEGAMGVVWSAVNEMTSRQVAIKFILRSSDDLRHRLLREAKACGSINHRNIVESLDMGQTSDGDPFLVMQLLTGETLDAVLQRKRRLTPTMASQIGRDIAKALAAAHEAKIIHRDLKPANIFLHQEPGTHGHVVKVLDFGVSKNLAASDNLATIANGAVGTPAYMSPEQYEAAPDLDARTDIWSFGVMLFEMLTGVRPFDGSTQEIMMKVLYGEIPLASRVVRSMDRGLVELVSRCMERERDARIASAAEIANILNDYAEAGETSNAVPEPRTPDADAVSTLVPQSQTRPSRPSYHTLTAQPAAPRPSFAALPNATYLAPNISPSARPTSEPERPAPAPEAPPSVIIATQPATRTEVPSNAPRAEPASTSLKPPLGPPLIVARGPTTSTAPMLRRIRDFDKTLILPKGRREKPEEARASAGRGLLLTVLTSLGGLIITFGVIVYVFILPGAARGTVGASPAPMQPARSLTPPGSAAPRISQPVFEPSPWSPSANASGAPSAATSAMASASPPSSAASAKPVGAPSAAGAGAAPLPPRVTPSGTAQPIRTSGPINITPTGSR